ncbi:type II CAAX endopeptidase family protein [Tabrizicola sp.]|uniref:type II CAAX endopeptidase family protein n=1 Tax=Tabrizicola sp. TaxID=2005166 RepID=UPI00286BFE3A|nr:type II CAAX endopeptidase family protein [Tabrizicola sp.]
MTRRPVAQVAASAPRSNGAQALITFLALAFGWTWGLWWIVGGLGPWPVPVTITLQLLSGMGPSVAGFMVVRGFDQGAGLRAWLRRCINWRIVPSWYALAFVGPPLVMLAALAMHALLGGTLPPSPAAGQPGPVLLQFVVVLVLGGPLGEEFGWRGYALPALSARLGWRWASLTLGAVWALWHVPLFYMPGMAQAGMPMALFLGSSVALSVLFARLSVNTAFSVLPAVTLHWSVNAWSWAIPVTPRGGAIQPYFLVMGLLFVIAVIVFCKPGPTTSHESLTS